MFDHGLYSIMIWLFNLAKQIPNPKSEIAIEFGIGNSL